MVAAQKMKIVPLKPEKIVRGIADKIRKSPKKTYRRGVSAAGEMKKPIDSLAIGFFR